MDQVKTGALIRTLRIKQNMTQLALAEQIGVSDKAVSKWERGCGAPDISLLPTLSKVLQVSTKALRRGDLEENEKSSGNLKKLRCYHCADCGNLLFSTDDAEVNCCGKTCLPLQIQHAEQADRLIVTKSDGEWYITSHHAMQRDHYISFVAVLTGDTLLIKKQYPEWGLETRIPFFKHGTLLWYCTKHGLFEQELSES